MSFSILYMQPLVSILLPIYNGNNKWLTQAINSILDQTFRAFELIILNDASTNDIEKTILAFVQQDQRIVYLKNQKNLKLTRTLNKGFAHAKGKYIARIDDDDIWSDEKKLEKQVNFMEKHPEYGLCWVDTIQMIDENGSLLQTVLEWEKQMRKLELISSWVINLLIQVSY